MEKLLRQKSSHAHQLDDVSCSVDSRRCGFGAAWTIRSFIWSHFKCDLHLHFILCYFELQLSTLLVILFVLAGNGERNAVLQCPREERTAGGEDAVCQGDTV